MNKFDKLYKNIISEANKQNKKWVQLPTYKGINKFYQKQHVDNRIESRYNNDINTLMLNQMFNMFIDELIRRNAWKGVKNKKGFTFHASKSDRWFSGEIQKDSKTNKKEFYVATFLPSNNPTYNMYDILITLDI